MRTHPAEQQAAPGKGLRQLPSPFGSRLSGAAAPSNDSFGAGAPVPPPPSSVSGSTVGATTQSAEPRPCGDVGSTVWYRLASSQELSVVADTYGSDYDTVLAVYTGSTLSNLSLVECNDDAIDLQSEVWFDVQPGVTYHIQVGGFDGDQGSYELNLSDGGSRASISGTVVGEQGPVGWVCVSVIDADDEWVGGDGFDSPDGAYQVEVPGAGQYRVLFEPCSEYSVYAGEWYDDRPDPAAADPITVSDGQAVTGIDAVLQVGGTISGRVIAPDGTPLDACVQVWDADDPWDWQGDAETDPQTGAYELVGLGSGEYKVYAYDCWWPREFVDRWYPSAPDHESADRVAVAAGQDTPAIDVVLPPGGSIGGRVTGASGQPLGDVCVDVYDVEGFWVSGADTLSDGTYEAAGIAPGQNKVEFTDCYAEELPSEWFNDERDFDFADLVPVLDGVQTPGIDAVLEAVGGITGRVRNAQNVSLAGTCVSVHRGGNLIATTTTASDGRYSFPSLSLGTYQLHVDPCQSPDEYAPEWFNDGRHPSEADPIIVTENQVVSANLILDRWGRIGGRVTDDQGQSLADVCVEAFQQADTLVGQTITTSTGLYALNRLTPGTYRIRFSLCDGSGSPVWYRNAQSFAAADLVPVQWEQVVTGIDVSLLGPGLEIEESGGETEIGEGGLTDTLSVRLATRPAADVVVDLGGWTAQGVQAFPSTLTFDEDTWDDPQIVSLQAQNDCLDDPDRTPTLTMLAESEDASYEGLMADLSVLIRDNDQTTELRLLGPGSVVRGAPAAMEAELTSGGQPVPGQPVTFRSSGEELGSAPTDQDGVARVTVPADQPYGPWDVEMAFDGDCDEASAKPVELGEATSAAAIEVEWEHEFADGTRVLKVNTITRELQFSAPGDVSAIHTDPAMEVRQLPTGESMIEVQYTAQGLTVAGRFLPARGLFLAAVQTPANAYLLTGLP